MKLRKLTRHSPYAIPVLTRVVKSRSRGYTIVEALIFLVVSSALFVAVYRTISGQQLRAEFTYGVQEFATRLQDLSNDVSTGYYDNVGNFRCVLNGSGEPRFTSGANQQGANRDCIFIGRVIQFAASDHGPADEGYRVYTVAGRRTRTVGSSLREVQDLAEANPVPITNTYGHDATQEFVTPNGLRVSWVRYSTIAGGAPTQNVGAVGYFTNFVTYPLTQLEDGSRSVDVIPINLTAVDRDENQTDINIYSQTETSPINPAGGVVICLEGGNGRMHAQLNLGGNLRVQSSELDIRAGGCPA